MNVVMGSSFEFLKILFEGEDEDTKKKKKKKNHADDLCGKYLHQLGELSKTLASTEPHYVRCVKPNDFHFTPIDGRAAFDVYKTYRQLLYAGVMEVVKIKKMGYPFRETFESFWEHRCLKNQYYRFVDGVDKNSNCKEGTQAICEAILRKPEQVIDKHTEKESTKYYWVLGNTKIWGTFCFALLSISFLTLRYYNSYTFFTHLQYVPSITTLLCSFFLSLTHTHTHKQVKTRHQMNSQSGIENKLQVWSNLGGDLRV